MVFIKVGKIKLSETGKDIEIKIENLPEIIEELTFYLYVPKEKVQQILESKLGETDVSLFQKVEPPSFALR